LRPKSIAIIFHPLPCWRGIVSACSVMRRKVESLQGARC
jgi:hypothetical protein